MVYDRADWHYGGDFPEELPAESGATPIGMFLGWAIKRGLIGELHQEHSSAAIAGVRRGKISGRDFLMQHCDEKFTDEELNEEGNRFARSYYETSYLDDYGECLGDDLPSLYHVEDSVQNQSKIEALLDQRLEAWRRGVVAAGHCVQHPRVGPRRFRRVLAYVLFGVGLAFARTAYADSSGYDAVGAGLLVILSIALFMGSRASDAARLPS